MYLLLDVAAACYTGNALTIGHSDTYAHKEEFVARLGFLIAKMRRPEHPGFNAQQLTSNFWNRRRLTYTTLPLAMPMNAYEHNSPIDLEKRHLSYSTVSVFPNIEGTHPALI